MTDAGFFKGTTTDQDSRFTDKQMKLMKQMKFNSVLESKVDMSKINLNSIKPWINRRLTELLGFEDDVVVAYVSNQLEMKYPNPKEIQVNLTGFLNAKNSRMFLAELWEVLLSAADTSTGVPLSFIDAQLSDIKNGEADEAAIRRQVLEEANNYSKNLNKDVFIDLIEDEVKETMEEKVKSPRKDKSPIFTEQRRRRAIYRRHSPDKQDHRRRESSESNNRDRQNRAQNNWPTDMDKRLHTRRDNSSEIKKPLNSVENNNRNIFQLDYEDDSDDSRNGKGGVSLQRMREKNSDLDKDKRHYREIKARSRSNGERTNHHRDDYDGNRRRGISKSRNNVIKGEMGYSNRHGKSYIRRDGLQNRRDISDEGSCEWDSNRKDIRLEETVWIPDIVKEQWGNQSESPKEVPHILAKEERTYRKINSFPNKMSSPIRKSYNQDYRTNLARNRSYTPDDILKKHQSISMYDDRRNHDKSYNMRNAPKMIEMIPVEARGHMSNYHQENKRKRHESDERRESKRTRQGSGDCQDYARSKHAHEGRHKEKWQWSDENVENIPCGHESLKVHETKQTSHIPDRDKERKQRWEGSNDDRGRKEKWQGSDDDRGRKEKWQGSDEDRGRKDKGQGSDDDRGRKEKWQGSDEDQMRNQKWQGSNEDRRRKEKLQGSNDDQEKIQKWQGSNDDRGRKEKWQGSDDVQGRNQKSKGSDDDERGKQMCNWYDEDKVGKEKRKGSDRVVLKKEKCMRIDEHQGGKQKLRGSDEDHGRKNECQGSDRDQLRKEKRYDDDQNIKEKWSMSDEHQWGNERTKRFDRDQEEKQRWRGSDQDKVIKQVWTGFDERQCGSRNRPVSPGRREDRHRRQLSLQRHDEMLCHNTYVKGREYRKDQVQSYEMGSDSMTRWKRSESPRVNRNVEEWGRRIVKERISSSSSDSSSGSSDVSSSSTSSGASSDDSSSSSSNMSSSSSSDSSSVESVVRRIKSIDKSLLKKEKDDSFLREEEKRLRQKALESLKKKK